MTQNENFNLIVKKFILNEFLAWFSGLSIAGGLITLFCGLFAWDYNGSTVAFGVGALLLVVGIFCLCSYQCLQKYDRMYGLFNGWEDGCDICKQLIKIRNSFDTAKDYRIVFNNHFSSKKYIIEAKGHPVHCPNCGRKLISFSGPRYW